MKNPARNDSFFIVTYEQRGRFLFEIPDKFPLDVGVKWLIDVIVNEHDYALKKMAAMSLAKWLGTEEPEEIVNRINQILNGSEVITRELFNEVHSWHLKR